MRRTHRFFMLELQARAAARPGTAKTFWPRRTEPAGSSAGGLVPTTTSGASSQGLRRGRTLQIPGPALGRPRARQDPSRQRQFGRCGTLRLSRANPTCAAGRDCVFARRRSLARKALEAHAADAKGRGRAGPARRRSGGPPARKPAACIQCNGRREPERAAAALRDPPQRRAIRLLAPASGPPLSVQGAAAAAPGT